MGEDNAQFRRYSPRGLGSYSVRRMGCAALYPSCMSQSQATRCARGAVTPLQKISASLRLRGRWCTHRNSAASRITASHSHRLCCTSRIARMMSGAAGASPSPSSGRSSSAP